MLAAVNISTRVPAPAGRDPAAHLVAVHAGQVPVEHDHVVTGDREMLERVVAVQHDVDRHALAAQPGADGPGQHLEVLDDQHPHEAPERCAGRVRVTARCQPHGTGLRPAAGVEPGQDR